MRKILVSFMLCAAILLQCTAGFAYSYVPFIGDGILSSAPVSVSLTDSNGQDTDSLLNAANVSVKCTVRPGAEYDGTALSVSLIAVAYKDGIMADYFVSSPYKFTKLGEKSKLLETSFDNTSLGATGLKVYVWDNVDNARPLLNVGEYGKSGNNLEAILIGGEKVEIDPLTKTGSVMVSAGYLEWPEVIVLTDNLVSDVKVAVKGTFPLSKNSHALVKANDTSPGSATEGEAVITFGGETYTVTVKQSIPQITDVKFKQFMADMNEENYYTNADVNIQYDLQNPTWTDELPSPNVNADGFTANSNKVDVAYSAKFKEASGNLKNISYVYSDRTSSHSTMTFFYFNVAPPLVGSQVFTLPYPSASVTSNEVDGCFTFTIDRSARIYMQNDTTAAQNKTSLADRGWTQAKNLVGTQQKTKNIMYYEFWTSASGGTVYTTNGDRVYYKDYYVKPGTTCTVSLPSGKKSPRIFVQYQNSNLVENPTYTSNGNSVDLKTTGVYKPLYKDAGLSAADGKYQMLEYPNNGSSITIPYNAKGNILYATSVFTNPSTPTPERQGLVIVPDEIVGGTALVVPSDMSSADTIEFDLNAPSRVYVFTSAGASSSLISNIRTALGDDWANTEFDPTGSGKSDDAISLAYRISSTAYIQDVRNKSSFYKDFVITSGESEHITINLDKSLSDKRIIVVVKPLS